MVEVVLPARGVSRPVWHRTVEEVWYVLEGHGEVWRCPPLAQVPSNSTEAPRNSSLTDGTDPSIYGPVPVGPGDALAIPTGWYFQFRAAPDAPLRFLCHTNPPWPGLDEAQPAPYGALGEPTV